MNQPSNFHRASRDMLVNYRIENETEDYILIRDLGPHDEYKTVTNEPEWVVHHLLRRLRGRKLYYIDSEGSTDQILIHDGRFAGFSFGGPRDE